ncbi:MAG TPA: DUF2062 domain-containing protein [Piscirickettsiaceae bacterium]|nr:DUF2062 domain-containing protein [Piscirickettsiaceae bacterium]HIQ39716.1 DUF2062 domain-containing protein [Sulfurivirga caldicuralii]
MPRKLFKKYTPHPDKIRKHKSLGWLGKWLGNPAIWHLHRHAVAKAFFIGLFWMTIPIPWQMIAAALTAIVLRANLPLSVVLVWISNPLTMPPIFYFNYRVGCWILGCEAQQVEWSMDPDKLATLLTQIGEPLYLGSVVVGFILGAISYVAIQLFWRWHVVRAWKRRQSSS